ncbi:replication-relaxation family protein [Streptomyces sp. NRRL B-24484]|uniref:replication-relaxation family protein n=1 Tax=Streptomyces sp. NRRL B-24484 TaxID=1463833 RepID=UPI000693D3FD|nr:replication-relaxation family protein [Streptomyces sp. NRRL B-24484]
MAPPAPSNLRAGRARRDGADFDRLVLASLYLHRFADFRQLSELSGMFDEGEDHSWRSRRLRALRRRGLIDHVTAGYPRQHTWFLTDAGRSVAGQFGELLGRSSVPLTVDALGVPYLSQHSRTVLDVHLAFLRDARRLGDDYGPLDWVPEVHHRLSERTRDALTADAVMRYTSQQKGRSHLRAFIEVDRGTEGNERLAFKLVTYARFFEHTPSQLGRRPQGGALETRPSWQSSYPVFPRILFVLADASEQRMRNRIRDLQVMAARNAQAAAMLREVPAGAALLDDLLCHGPSAPVWTSLAGGDRPRCAWNELQPFTSSLD